MTTESRRDILSWIVGPVFVAEIGNVQRQADEMAGLDTRLAARLRDLETAMRDLHSYAKDSLAAI